MNWRLFWTLLGLLWTFFSSSSSAALPKTDFDLFDPGGEFPVAYERYGDFRGTGTNEYAYVVQDVAGLAKAAGEGVFPCVSHLSDPAFQDFLRRTRAPVNVWDYVESASARDDFLAWASAGSDISEGTRLYFTGEALRRAGHIRQAIKAYYAILIHFPKTTLKSSDGAFYWYPALEALSRIRKLCAMYPELGVQLEGAFIDIERNPEKDPAKDIVKVSPGKFSPVLLQKTDPGNYKIIQERGKGKVRVVKYGDGHWALLKDGLPFVVKGIQYGATKVGESAHALNLRSWMTVDDNGNWKNDGMYDSWVDKNRNNLRDPDEPVVGDAVLLKEMGANAIRFYHGVDTAGNYRAGDYNKPLMRALSETYGIYFILGDFLGAYTVGSGADWNLGTDYSDPAQRERMKAGVRAMVLDHKDEPYCLMWLLGNENQHESSRTNAAKHPEAYAKFVNEVAAMIKELDPDHPVAVCQMNDKGLKEMSKYAPSVDIYGANVYSGAFTLGAVTQLVKYYYDRPLLFTEWGADAYAEGKGPDGLAQAGYIKENWLDTELNMAGNTGEGNVIGGVLFEWMDEWWKSSKGDSWGDPFKHNTEGDYGLPFPDNWCHEEWLGIMGQGDGTHSPFLREEREAYRTLKGLWNKRDSSQ